MKNLATKRHASLSWALGFVIIWTFAGFPLLAGLTEFFGSDNNSTISVFLRALAVACAVFVIFRSPKQSLDIALLLFGFFWVAYLMRFVITLHLFEEPQSRPAYEFWLWAVGACLLPSLAAFKSANATLLTKVRMPLLVGTLTAIILSFIEGSTEMLLDTGETRDINRWNLSSLNPIALGHLGVTGILIGIAVLLSKSRSRFEAMLALVAISTGLIVMVLANSRGPALALAAPIIFFFLAKRQYGKLIVLVFFCLSLLAGQGMGKQEGDSFLNAFLGRFSDLQTGSDQSADIRAGSFQGAFNQFLGSPFLGDALEESTTGFYPHNLLIEAYMSTGIIGGIPFTLLIIAALTSSWRLLRDRSGEYWVGLIALQYIVGSQFSGSLYQSAAMWVAIALVIAVAPQRASERHDI